MIDVVVFQNISILKEMRMLCLGISDFCLEIKRIGNPEKKDNLDSSDALSDQVLSLDTYTAEDGRDREVHCRGSCTQTLLGRI